MNPNCPTRTASIIESAQETLRILGATDDRKNKHVPATLKSIDYNVAMTFILIIIIIITWNNGRRGDISAHKTEIQHCPLTIVTRHCPLRNARVWTASTDKRTDVPAKFGRRPFPRSSVILFTE